MNLSYVNNALVIAVTDAEDSDTRYFQLPARPSAALLSYLTSPHGRAAGAPTLSPPRA